MRITNRLSLPEPIVNAVKNDDYNRGFCQASVTTLLSPPRLVALREKHGAEIEEDASDRIWSLFGQAMHAVLERANTLSTAERRLYMELGGWTVSGQMDLYRDGLLQDYKFVTVWKFKDQSIPEEYVQQLNCYAVLLRHHGHPVTQLQIVGILRDWSKNEARRNGAYPQSGIQVRDVPIWDPDTAYKFMEQRVLLHRQAQVSLPNCTDEERWRKPDVYAVQKKGAKRAFKLCETQQEADSLVETQGKDYEVQKRPGELTRCLGYCPVMRFCDQFKAGA